MDMLLRQKAWTGRLTLQFFNYVSIEYMLSGIPDQIMAYDVLTKRPRSMEERINLVTWHLTCRGESQFRFLESTDQFGRDMRGLMTKEIVKSLGDMRDDKLMTKATNDKKIALAS